MPQPSFQFEAIGTFFEIATPRELTRGVREQILSLVEIFDRQFSRFRNDSIVSLMAKEPGIYAFPDEVQPLFEYYESLYEITNGKVTPLIGGSLEALGYDAHYSLSKKGVSPAPLYEETVKRIASILKLSQPAVFDVGAAGKGCLVDKIARCLEANGVTAYTVDGSGDMLHKGKTHEVVGLEDPAHAGKVIGSVIVKNEALCASATNRRRWGDDLHHIVDPVTGKPSQDIIATWVIADTAMIADGLSTALFFVEPDILKNKYTYEYMRVHANGSIDFSAAFEGALYKEESWAKK
mgnify:CR=1 FL=1